MQITKPAPTVFGTGAARMCDDGFEMPKALREVQPKYTRRAMEEKARGIVNTQVIVGADGWVEDARVIRRLHPDLDRAALATLQHWHFEPGRLHGAAVRSLITIEFTFTLR